MKIGIIYGAEDVFPAAIVDRINSLRIADVTAEHIKIGAVRLAEPCPYRVIIDRISHSIPFYRSYLKNAAVCGTTVINNPFLACSGDRFCDHSVASKLGLAVPRTVLLPHKSHPPGTTARSMRNLVYPLDWDEVFRYVGFPAFLKPNSRGRAYKVHDAEEFFHAYDQTGDLSMMLEQAIACTALVRGYVVGREHVHVSQCEDKLRERVVRDSLALSRALGYDLNTVEFAIADAVPYAIGVNAVPDADSATAQDLEWMVRTVAEFAVGEALKEPVRRDSGYLTSVAVLT